MKLLACGDLHITDQKPERRLDEDYLQTISDKLDFIFETAREKNVDVIIFPGDVFNSHRANDRLKAFLAEKILRQEKDVFCIYGQHDMRYHSSDKTNTPLNVLHAAGLVEILNDVPISLDGIRFYGASFGEDIPEIKDEFKNGFNILVTHRMIVDEKLWEGQEDFQYSNLFLSHTDFDLIISGDNHKYFIQRMGPKALINCGSLMRSAIDQEHHKPTVVYFDTETLDLEEIQIPVKDFYDIMDISKAIEAEKRNEELEAFIKVLKESDFKKGELEKSVFDFSYNLNQFVIKHSELEEGVKNIIKEIME